MDEQEQASSEHQSRRKFLKLAGVATLGAQVGGMAGAGIAAGNDPASYTGWEHLEGGTQFFDRKPYEIEGLPYTLYGPTRRPEQPESALARNSLIMRSMMQRRNEQPEEERQEQATTPGRPPGGGMMPAIDDFPEELQEFYSEHPDIYELDKYRFEVIRPKAREDRAKYENYYKLIDAYSSAWSTRGGPTGPPEESDFQLGGGRRIPDPLPFKSDRLASKLIKKMAHLFGATMVGVTKLNPDWCYNYGLRGSENSGTWEIPSHWENVIAFGIPHEWEQVMGNPHVGTSYDAYARVTIAARRLENFIKSLGYSARAHSPMDGYDLIAVPILVEAGLGQQGRHGIVITPETGSNFRAAFVTTNLPMEIDKPIDFGVTDFCRTCKLCAEICPSSSISMDETEEDQGTRGYTHWTIDQTSCFNFWNQSMGGMGCRVCLIACPYSRRDNWVHQLARTVDTNDPTGLADNALTWMQETFFKRPEASEMLPPPDGRFENFSKPAEWLTVENYLDIEVLDPTRGD